jgi:serine/threonine protein kinase/Tol biopolymer transport system component
MHPARWQHIERIYHEAQARLAGERAAYLAEACSGDGELRREVGLLLAQGASADEFLNRDALTGALSLNEPAALTGRRLGIYHVQELIGAGGMGEVYRARDTRLGRDVAIKILPAVFVSDPQRLARFEREARVLASLNHPNIATIHGIEEGDPSTGSGQAAPALVMELVDGETLAERIARGPLRIGDALAIATQIAEALDAAHEKGIVHRDLKPANIKITPGGTVKVLDFGLAKAIHPEGLAGGPSNAPTMTVSGTREGVIVGTAAYMSPEQARGLAVDKRTDIWAFGCVLYEMLTGRAAFSGETISDVVAAILEREPDWDALPSALSPALRRVLRRCLDKDPKRRVRDIGDARADLADTSTPETAAGTGPSTGRRRDIWRIVAVAALGGVLVLSLVIRDRLTRATVAPSSVTRTTLTLPGGQELDTAGGAAPIAISPDGQRVAYVARRDGRAQLYVRELDAFEPMLMAGTDGAMYPFFSPDGMSVAFFADGKLKRSSILGGGPVPICDAPNIGPGGTWGSDGTIVFDPGDVGLMHVPAAGGMPRLLTTADPSRDARDLAWPRFLPGGRALVLTLADDRSEQASVLAALALDSGEWHVLGPGEQAQYVSSGHLVYHAPHVREGEVQAIQFDAASLAVRGRPFPVLDSVFRARGGGAAYFAAALAGTLVFAPGGLQHTLVDVDRAGRRTPLLDDRRGFRFPSLSPDGRRLAVTIDPRPSQIWVYDLARRSGIPIATEGHSLGSVWTRDGRHVLYGSQADIYQRTADASAPPERLLTRDRPQYPSSWSSDGRLLVFHEENATNTSDIRIMQIGGGERPLITTPATELHGEISPDGRWFVFTSDESGRNEVHVRPFPNVDAGQWIVSRGGESPRWSRDGREIFYMNGASLMSVTVDLSARSFVAGAPVTLLTGPFDTTQDMNYDVFPDGQHFVMVQADPDARPTRLQVVLNWSEELKRREAVSRTGR